MDERKKDATYSAGKNQCECECKCDNNGKNNCTCVCECDCKDGSAAEKPVETKTCSCC